MQLTDDQSKIDIVSRLVKEGTIDFNEAIKLLEKENNSFSFPISPLKTPWDINQPWAPLAIPCRQYNPYEITFTTSNTLLEN